MRRALLLGSQDACVSNQFSLANVYVVYCQSLEKCLPWKWSEIVQSLQPRGVGGTFFYALSETLVKGSGE